MSRGYDHICIAGKSMSSPVAVALAHRIAAQNISLILLTPIGTAVQDVGATRTLAVIGTADPLYSAEQVSADADRANVTWQAFLHLNHGLEMADDWKGSVAALGQIIGACEGFLQQGTT
jgi:hypothetical protein